MTFKQFVAWCNDRSADGRWGLREAILCLEVIGHVRSYPFWKRKKVWNDFRDPVVNGIVEPTNRKIQEVLHEQNHL